MTDKEIVQAMRLCLNKEGDCRTCNLLNVDQCVKHLVMAATDRIERLTDENAALREKQAEAEAERDALLGELRKSGCTYCKYETVCEVNPWLLSQKVCDHCDKRESCVCLTCTGDGSETDKWKWRGLPEAPKDGESNA